MSYGLGARSCVMELHACGHSGTTTCPFWDDRSLKLHGRQRWKAQNFHSLQPSVSQSASELNKLHGECDLPCLPIYSSLDSKSIVFDLVYSSYKHVAFFSAVVFSSNHVLHTSAVRTLSSGYKPTGSLNFTLQSLPKCQLLLTSDCS